jgi:ferredoxin-NADP reductase
VIFLMGGDPDLLSSASLTRLVPNLVDRDVYLCGPPGLATAVRAALTDAGLAPSQLHEERFAF